MSLPRRTTFPTRRRDFARDLLDPASAWALDEYATTLPVASEPYDWTLEEDAPPFPQLVPVPPPARSGVTASRRAKRSASLSEAALLVPIEKTAPRRKRAVSPVLLLLLSVIALFVFAYFTQS